MLISANHSFGLYWTLVLTAVDHIKYVNTILVDMNIIIFAFITPYCGSLEKAFVTCDVLVIRALVLGGL